MSKGGRKQAKKGRKEVEIGTRKEVTKGSHGTKSSKEVKQGGHARKQGNEGRKEGRIEGEKDSQKGIKEGRTMAHRRDSLR